MLATPGTFTNINNVLVGRTVANAQFLRALAQHADVGRVMLMTGESADVASLEALTAPWGLPQGRIVTEPVWSLPRLLGDRVIDVLHHGSHVDRLLDLWALRDRYARKATPVTGQIHSLSYPRVHQDLARLAFLPPGPCDAVFCSSSTGKQALERALSDLDTAARDAGMVRPLTRPRLPVVPLGVDVDALGCGDRDKARTALGLTDNDCCFLVLARFTEADKVDLFPFVEVFARLLQRPTEGTQRPVLVLAGARQGTKTPEMVNLWAQSLGIGHALRIEVDFVDELKPSLLAAADVFVSPVDNVQETFGQSVVEAMAAGLPIIASDFDGYRDTVTEEVGIRVPTRIEGDWSELSQLAPLLYERPLHLVLSQSVTVDGAALEAAMRLLLSDRALREKLGHAAKSRARQHYAWPRVIQQYEQEWRRLGDSTFALERKPHPLSLRLDHVFGGYGALRLEGAVKVQRTEHSRRPGRPYVIYPELKGLLTDDDVTVLLNRAERACTVEELELTARERLGHRPPWVARFMVAWLMKHALVASTSG